MPRQARRESGSGIYHIMIRGVDRQVIFRDDGDRSRFLNMLKETKAVSGFKLHAFCLMPNHVHLLLEQGAEPLGIVFKRIGVRYAGWYNKKYDRVGHLFQDRFRSENVETDRYYMTVLRYILWNPVKAHMVPDPAMYRWSSYRAYEKGAGSLTDTEYAEKLFGLRENLVAFLREDSDESAMDEEQFDRRLREEQAREIFGRVTNCDSAAAFRQLDPAWQKAYVRELYAEGLSTLQIAKLTDIPRSTIGKTIRGIERKQKETIESPTADPIFREEALGYLTENDEIW